MQTLTILLMGHGKLGYHLKQIGQLKDKTCKLCKKDPEISKLVLCECEALASIRLLFLCKAYVKAEKICQQDPENIIKLEYLAWTGFRVGCRSLGAQSLF